MKSKSLSVLVLLLLSAGTLLLLAAAVMPAAAQVAAPGPAVDEVNSCRTCHTRLYQNYDTGNWFCLCANRNERCVACHLGDQTAFDEEVAHAGLVPNPLVDPATYCGQCHPEDYQARVDGFIAMTGAQPPKPLVHYDYVAPEEVAAPSSFLTETRPAWQVYGGLGLALAAFVTFGIMCYRCRKGK
jgi:cytochrome c553